MNNRNAGITAHFPRPSDVDESSFTNHPDKKSLLKLDIGASVRRFVNDLENTEQMISQSSGRLGDQDFILPEAFSDRLVESTFHPSQIHSAAHKKALVDVLAKVRKLSRQHVGPLPLEEKEDLITRACAEIFRISLKFESDLSHAQISSHSRFGEHDVQYLSGLLLDLEDLSQSAIESLYREVDVKDIDPFDDAWKGYKIDESWESVKDAKTMLLSGISPHHTVWIDFDGAKRPWAIMFSMYGSLIMEDIRYAALALGLRGTVFHERSQVAAHRFLKNDLLIHVLTGVLKNNNLEAERKSLLEDLMIDLKKRRVTALKGLQSLRLQVADESRVRGKEYLSLSKRIRFALRLDHRHIEALQAFQSEGHLPEEHEYYADLQTFFRIALQVAEMTQLDDDLVAQVMIANAVGSADFIALQQYFDSLCADGDRERGIPQLLKPIPVVPLFESKSTVLNFKTFLDEVWEYFEEDHEQFCVWLNEVFFAGSDLSKTVGQLSALRYLNRAAVALQQFQEEHDVRFNFKLGTGESSARQLGFLDPQGYLSPLSPSLLEEQDIPYDPQNQSSNGEIQHFLESHFGPDWKSLMEIQPSGFHEVLRKCPWIGSFTLQSRGREMAFTSIEPSRLRQLYSSLYQLHLRNEEDTVVPDWLERAADDEEDFFLRMMGNVEEDAFKPGRTLLNFPTLLEKFSKLKPVVRDRGISRTQSTGSFPEQMELLMRPGVDSRAIATNTAANFLFPLALLGKGSALLHAWEMAKKSSDFSDFQNLIAYLHTRSFLKEYRCFVQIWPQVQSCLDNYGFTDLSQALDGELSRIRAFIPLIRKHALSQLVKPEERLRVMNFTSPSRDLFISALIPELRYLFDDDYDSPHLHVYRSSFERQALPVVHEVMSYLSQAEKLRVSFSEALSSCLHPEEEGNPSEKLWSEFQSRQALHDLESTQYLKQVPTEAREAVYEVLDLAEPTLHISSELKDSWNAWLSTMSYILGRVG